MVVAMAVAESASTTDGGDDDDDDKTRTTIRMVAEAKGFIVLILVVEWNSDRRCLGDDEYGWEQLNINNR